MGVVLGEGGSRDGGDRVVAGVRSGTESETEVRAGSHTIVGGTCGVGSIPSTDPLSTGSLASLRSALRSADPEPVRSYSTSPSRSSTAGAGAAEGGGLRRTGLYGGGLTASGSDSSDCAGCRSGQKDGGIRVI